MIQRSCQWCSNGRTENHCLHWRDELMVVCQQITAEPCGLDPSNKSTRSTLVTFWSCRQASRSLGRRGTLASLSTVSCRCLHTVLHFAGPDFTTWGSYVHSVDHYQQKLQRHWYRRSFHVAWTTATLCCTEWPTNSWGKYSRCRLLRQGWSQERNVANTSHRYCINFIGCQSDDELNSRLPAWYTKCCQAKYLPVWLTIFISPQKGLLRKESALSLVFTVILVADVLLQLDHVSRTTYLPVCETRKSAAQNSEKNWKHSCFKRTAAHRDFFWLLHLINTLTCLLTKKFPQFEPQLHKMYFT